MPVLSPAVVQEKNKLVGAAVWAWLLEVEISETTSLYLTTNNESVTYDSKTWIPFPLDIGDHDDDISGTLPEKPIRFSNASGELAVQIEQNRGFVGKKAVLYLVTLAGGVTLAYKSTFRIARASYDENAAEFLLGNFDVMKLPFPRPTFLRHRCPYYYKGTLCAYSGAIVDCDKTLWGDNGCTAHDNEAHFGGFPGLVLVF